MGIITLGANQRIDSILLSNRGTCSQSFLTDPKKEIFIRFLPFEYVFFVIDLFSIFSIKLIKFS
jgi:hypothetical protein